MMEDVGNIMGLEVHNLIFYQALVATVDAFDLKAIVDCCTGHGADSRVHTGGITTRCQYADSLDCCHNTCVVI